LLAQAVLDAQKLPSACPQFIPLVNRLTGDEDCLYLNVWAPAKPAASPRPVMVWIHGGGFTAGQGAYTADDGATLALEQDVVVVAMNYRLGVFGFLAHPALSDEDPQHPGSGNYGLQDQMAALRWVRENIARFGGDPGNVTLFGQSAGAVSVCAQLVSPQAVGLFHRAIIMSGPCETPLSPLSGASELGLELSRELGCAADDLACLRSRDTAQVANVLPPDPSFAFGEGYTVWWPVLDGFLLPSQIIEAFQSGEFARVPVLSGATRDEGSMLLWISHDMLFKPLEPQDYLSRLEYLVGDSELAEQVARQYPLSAYAGPFEALTAAFSDGFFNCLTRHQSQALARHVPTWAYQFNYQNMPFFVPGVDLGAYHGGDLQYVFGRPASLFSSQFDEQQAALSRQVMAYWGEFARRGDPNHHGAPTWPQHDRRDLTLLIDSDTQVSHGVHEQACRFWQQLAYLRPANP
jgi:para-nitrobenzyl esterase